MFNNLLETNINFYNYILAKQKLFNPQTNFSYLNILKPANSTEIKETQIFPQSSDTIKDIKFSKFNSDDLNKIDKMFNKTNRDFYNSDFMNKRRRNFNFIPENFNTINYNKNSNSNSINDLFISYNSQKRKNDISYSNNNSGKFLYNISFNSNTKNINNRNNVLRHSITEKKMIINYSKILYNFKNMKMFYAHMELLISLYLKRNYKYFIQQMKSYKKVKFCENNLNLYHTTNNRNQPIINLNNSHCSLYYSININKDTNSNNESINNNKKQSMKNININKNIVNKIQNINNMLNTKNEIYANKERRTNNKGVYVPKNKANKLKKTNYKNKNNSIKKSSPIKEMNIDLKRMNINANKANNSSSKSNSKNKKDKLKISKKNSSIYKRPKDNNSISKKAIKEIKILNKEIVLTPFESKTKTIFEKVNPMRQSYNIKENNTIKKVYIKKNNLKDKKDTVKTNLFRNNSDLTAIKSFTNFNKNRPREILIKKIITTDKRIFINIKYMIHDLNEKAKNKKKIYIKLKEEYNISLAIIKNTLLMPENINQNMIFSDIFNFDNDKKGFSVNENKKNYGKNISLLNFAKKIRVVIIRVTRKYLLNDFKKYIYLKRIINGNNNKILNHYLKRFTENKNNNIKKSGIYHKINYNDDFNINKKIKPEINKEKSNNIQSRISQNNITSKNNKNIIFRNKYKNRNQSSIDFSKTYKYWNKEINITVHENKENKINKKSSISSYNKKK